MYILCEGLYALPTVFHCTSVRDFVICLCLGATSAGQLALRNQIPLFGQNLWRLVVRWSVGFTMYASSDIEGRTKFAAAEEWIMNEASVVSK